jgi:signal transduction histidine kinase
MKQQTVRVLLVERCSEDVELIRQALTSVEGTAFDVGVSDCLQNALIRLMDESIDVVLLDLSLPDSNGLETLRAVIQVVPGLPVVVLAGQSDEELALRAIQEGAQDYLVREKVNRSMLVRVIRYGIERKRAEKEIAEAKKEVEAANASKSQFLANMSHEIRTPMTGVVGMTDLLLRSGLSDQQREFAEVIKTSANNLISVINDILDISKIEAGGMSLVISEFKPRDQIEEITNTLSATARNKRVRLKWSVAPDVPVRLYGDATRIRQILSNLVGNAVKFTKDGEVAVTVDLDAVTENGVVLRISVRDTGIGIPADQRERIFEQFTQVDGSATREYGGTGLGLAICNGLVKLLGGKIGVDSEPGRGSCFWVKLPMERDTSEPRFDAVVAGTTSGELRVLIAEDNPVNHKVAAMLLDQLGHRTQWAQNGQEAVELWRRGRFDVVLMDIQMPIMNGVRATREIRRLEVGTGRHTPIIALTAHALKEDRDLCMSAGVDGYLTKPIVLDDLCQALDRYVNPEPAPSITP